MQIIAKTLKDNLVKRTSCLNKNLSRNFSSVQSQKPFNQRRFLVAGCKGQIGLPLARAIANEVGAENVIACDVSDKKVDLPCKQETLDVTNFKKYEELVKENKIDYIIHLAAILSALGEQQPDLATDVNVYGYINAMKIARDNKCQIFVPSTIGAFGGDKFPKHNTPDDTILQPETIYGVSKVFNEMFGTYYHDKFGVDFRSIRYPGVISSEKYAFNGTTDYSTEIFFHALEKKYYKCWLAPKTELPMIYIDDCITATMQFLKADKSQLTRTTYNLAGISFTPEQLSNSLKKYTLKLLMISNFRIMPEFSIDYEPDFRQKIADAWPKSLDDTNARKDWGWTYNITVDTLAQKIFDGKLSKVGYIEFIGIADEFKKGLHKAQQKH